MDKDILRVGKTDLSKYFFVKKFRKYALMIDKGICIVSPDCIWKPFFWRINKKVAHSRKMAGKEVKMTILDDLMESKGTAY